MTLRHAFSLGILLVAAAYTWFAFTELSFMDRARLGPGFFPRVIGLTTIALTLYSMVVDLRRPGTKDEGTPYLRDILIFFAYCFLFVAALPYLGGLLSMVAFMFASLFTFNRGMVLVNVLVAITLPLSLYLLFDVWLNAAFPSGRIPLPW